MKALRGSRSLLVILALTLGLAGCGSPLTFSPTTLPDGQVGSPYEVTITVSQNHTPVAGGGVETGSLPPGLDFKVSEQHDNTMRISGTPTAAGTFSFTISVWCYGTNVVGDSGEQAYTLVVK